MHIWIKINYSTDDFGLETTFNIGKIWQNANVSYGKYIFRNKLPKDVYMFLTPLNVISSLFLHGIINSSRIPH